MARTSSANIMDYIGDVGFPTEKAALIDSAQQNNAPEEVLEQIRALPDRTFNGPADIESWGTDATQ